MEEVQQIHKGEEAPINQGPLSEADWVAVAFAVFALLFIVKILPKINNMLDSRSTRIARELSEATALKNEAQALFNKAERRAIEAEKATIEMIANAKAEAKRIAQKAEKDMNEEAARKLIIVEKKIKRAEHQAIENVKKQAVEEATKIATKLLLLKSPKMHKELLPKSIEKISSSIN